MDDKDRECGSCRACCIHTPMPKMGKPAGVPCQFLKGRGCTGGSCSIYDTRPQECVKYKCAWLEGYFGKSLRPDKCGVLFEVWWIEHPRHLTILEGKETRPGGLDDCARRIEQAMPPATVALVVLHGGKDVSFIGQREDLEVLKVFMANCTAAGGVTAMMDGEPVHVAFDKPFQTVPL